MIEKRKNTCRLQGVVATTTPFDMHISSSRKMMRSNHLAQAVSPLHSDIPRALTGLESQLEVFDIHMPTDAIITSVHHRFRKGLDKYSIKANPTITIIFQCQVTGQYDTLDITTYHSKHRVYGVKHKLAPIVSQLRPGMSIPMGTVFATSPNLKDGNIFSNGLSCNVVNLSLPSTIEDGYAVTESFRQRAALTEIVSSIAQWGRKTYPLNIYGTEDEFKAFPEIGERIREDGLVFALREYNPTFDALEMTTEALMHVDMVNDIRIYGTPNALVTDINVESGIGESKAKPVIPPPMTAQTERYIAHNRDYYGGILEIYDKLARVDKNLNLSPRLIQLITRAYADSPNVNKNKSATGGTIRRTYKSVPLDEYRVEITCVRENPIGLGAKVTGYAGDKGVICRIMADELAPVDSDGNRADVIKFAKSAIARMNPSQIYEQYVNAASRDMSKWIKAVYMNPNAIGIKHYLSQNNLLEQKWILTNYASKKGFDVIWDRLMAYYKAAAPLTYVTVLSNYLTDIEKTAHIQSIVDSGIYLYIPTDSDHISDPVKMFKDIEQVVSPTYGPVTYVDDSGKTVTTKDKVFIGIQQIIILEKSDQHPMAVSSGVIQHHGLLAGPNKISRNGHPSKVQAFKVFSETEVRMYAAYMGPRIIAQLLAEANSPEAHKARVGQLLESDTPSNMSYIPNQTRGTSRPLLFIKNTLLTFGLMLCSDRDKDVPSDNTVSSGIISKIKKLFSSGRT